MAQSTYIHSRLEIAGTHKKMSAATTRYIINVENVKMARIIAYELHH